MTRCSIRSRNANGWGEWSDIGTSFACQSCGISVQDVKSWTGPARIPTQKAPSCQTSCRSTGCGGACGAAIPAESFWGSAAHKACCGVGACTSGCAAVVKAKALAAAATATKHEWKYCHVHESDKNRTVKTSKMVEKKIMTQVVVMEDRKRKIKKIVMKDETHQRFEKHMVEETIDYKEIIDVPAKRTVKKMVTEQKEFMEDKVTWEDRE